MAWKFYSGITGLKDKEILHLILPYKFFNSLLTERKIKHFMDNLHETKNCLNGNVDLSIVYRCTYSIGYFLTQRKETVKEINIDLDHDCLLEMFHLLQMTRLGLSCIDLV